MNIHRQKRQFALGQDLGACSNLALEGPEIWTELPGQAGWGPACGQMERLVESTYSRKHQRVAQLLSKGAGGPGIPGHTKFKIHRRLSKLSPQPPQGSRYFPGEEARPVQKLRWSLGSPGFSALLSHHQLPKWAASVVCQHAGKETLACCWRGSPGLGFDTRKKTARIIWGQGASQSLLLLLFLAFPFSSYFFK